MSSEAVWCDGTTHRAEIEIITFVTVEQAENVNRTLVIGDKDTVMSKLKELKESSSPSESIFIEYCCNKCKEVANG